MQMTKMEMWEYLKFNMEISGSIKLGYVMCKYSLYDLYVFDYVVGVFLNIVKWFIMWKMWIIWPLNNSIK